MSLKTAILDLLFPPKCPFCGELLDRGTDGFCGDCQRELPWLAGREAEQTFEFVELCVSPLRYQERVRKAIHRYKFQGRRCYAAVFGGLMAQCAGDHFSAPFDLVCWAPLSAKRRRKRGYDQAELLALEVGRVLGVPAVRLLDKLRDNPAQSGLNDPAARRANVLGAYAPAGKTDLTGKRVLLCDDVATSGATLSECARVLRQMGAEAVCAVTFARAHGQSGAKFNKS